MELVYHEKSVLIDIRSASVVADAIYDFISEYTDKISHESGTDILTFNNRFSIRTAKLDGSDNTNFYLIRGDATEVNLGNFGYWVYNNSNVKMFLKILGNIFILKLVRESYPSEGYGVFAWIESDTSDFITPIIRTNAMSIDIGTYYNALLSAPNQNYSLKQMFSFSVDSQKLLFTDIAYISNSDNILIPIQNIYSCSTLTRDVVITMNGRNYYAIGANFIGLVGD